MTAPGTTLGVYRIERSLGSGGMGTVFLAYDTSLQRPVAVKVMDAAAVFDPLRSHPRFRALLKKMNLPAA